jgi:uncharacterized Fe-S center protein
MLIDEKRIKPEELESVAERVINFLNEMKINSVDDLERIVSENHYTKKFENEDFISVKMHSNESLFYSIKKHENYAKNQDNIKNNNGTTLFLHYNTFIDKNLYNNTLELEIKKNYLKIIVRCYCSIKDYKLCNVDFFNNKIQSKELNKFNIKTLKKELKKLTSEKVYVF